MAFISLTKELLSEGYEYVLSEKRMCQDPLEQFFASQRSAVGSNHNPTVGEFNRALLVKENTKAISITSKRGNCRGSAQPSTVVVDETPLRKRQRTN